MSLCLYSFVRSVDREPFIVSGGKVGGRVDEARTRFRKTTTKLHKVHNDYVTALADANVHQRQFMGVTLPCLLDYQQDTQEHFVTLT